MVGKLEKVKGHPGIYRRNNRYVVTFRDQNGRARKRFARTLAEARTLKATTRADVARGEHRTLSRVSFAEYAHDWIESYAGRTSKGLREQTRADYKKRLEQDAIPYFGRRRLAEIEPREIKSFAARVAARGIAPNTVRLALAPVKALFATAFEEGLIRSNPAAGLRIVQASGSEQPEEERVKALTEDELRCLLGKIPAEHRLFFEFLAHTGVRIGEAIALTWAHVDFGRKRVCIRRRFYRGGFAPPKSRYGRRDVPLSEGMARSLWALRKERRGGDDELVFTSERGRLIDQSNLMSRVLKPAAVEAGLGEWIVSAGGKRTAESWVGFHTFRHTAASMLFRSGLNAKQVQVWLGHHSPAFTLATYVHLLSDDLPDAAFLDALTAAAEIEEGEALPSTIASASM